MEIKSQDSNWDLQDSGFRFEIKGSRQRLRLTFKVSLVLILYMCERETVIQINDTFIMQSFISLSATRRQPIKGAAGRPFSDPWQDSLRLTEHRYTTSSYTESRSAPRFSAAPLSAPLSVPKSTAPPSVPAKARRRVPVWVQLLLLAAVTGFLLFVYHSMESNQMSPFRQPGLENSGK